MKNNLTSESPSHTPPEVKIGEIQFSRGTYQVQVFDHSNDFWVFLQLDENGNQKDAFCYCDEEISAQGCKHIHAAVQAVFRGHHLPLHIRFSHSLWHQLSFLCGKQNHFGTLFLEKRGKEGFRSLVEDQILFTLRPLNQDVEKQLSQMVDSKVQETEETSIKFSNLPSNEYILWKEGRPSPELQYELSFWSDLGKKLMLLQESGNFYEISFQYNSKKLPKWIQINFEQLEVGFALLEDWLPEVIPTFATVDSPLPINDLQEEGIEKIIYDKNLGRISIVAKGESVCKEGIQIGDWRYIPEKSFFATKRQGLLASSFLEGKEIAKLLNEHEKLVEKTLMEYQIHSQPVSLSYFLTFDQKQNLHLSAYVKKPQDLSKETSRRFGNWVFIEKEGFYRIEGFRFPDVETVINRQHVSDFVSQQQLWLDTIDGFKTHTITVESQISYSLDKNHYLHFESTLPLSEGEKVIDLGQWVYIKERGFYKKSIHSAEVALHTSIDVEPDEVSLFIKMNKQELQSIPHFFTDKCPIEKTSLRILLDEFENILITPEYMPKKEFENSKLSYFEDYVYIPGEGFCEIPIDLNLPERFRESVEIQPENQEKFIQYELDHLREFVSHLDNRLTRPKTFQLAAHHVEKEEGALSGMFSLKLFYQSELGEIEVVSLWKAWRKGNRYVFSQAGLLDLKEDRFYWLRQLHDKKVDKRQQTLKLTNLDLFRLNAHDSIEPSSQYVQSTGTTHTLLREIKEFVTPHEPDITGMHVQLRPYQEIGVKWLWSLYYHRLSGLLCDDMGLGKTLQAMALVAAAINYSKLQNEKKKLYFLVVCPTSVIYHWQDKLQKFFPALRVCTFYGSNRNLDQFQKEYDLLLTSYGVWRHESRLLSQVPFEIAILDEIQMAKNQNSKLHASLLHINAKMRLGMTGTPIENRLRELKSLFDITLPTYMPQEKEYREFFIRPVEKENNRKRQLLLSRFIKPFVLRRKKEDVLTDLPEKIEEIAYCPLLPDQQKLYQEVLLYARDQILGDLQNEENAIPYLHIFALLSRLKQICDHPAVYFQDPSQYAKYQSGKWDLFLELLHEARDGGHKVVVFSQYLAQLDIIENYLQENHIGFARLRGATVKRGEEVRRFQEDPNCVVFVASLQAGGLGIDLTAASIVIHIDRWWNAARENQATDRVHRIGQTRGVQVFKLVTRGTFEEKIDAMIVKKGQLMEETVGADDHEVIKRLDRNEILDLLADIKINQEEDQQDTIFDGEEK